MARLPANFNTFPTQPNVPCDQVVKVVIIKNGVWMVLSQPKDMNNQYNTHTTRVSMTALSPETPPAPTSLTSDMRLTKGIESFIKVKKIAFNPAKKLKKNTISTVAWSIEF